MVCVQFHPFDLRLLNINLLTILYNMVNEVLALGNCMLVLGKNRNFPKLNMRISDKSVG